MIDGLLTAIGVILILKQIPRQSQALGDLAGDGRIAIVGAMYDVATGGIEFLPAPGLGHPRILNPV